MVVFKQIQTPLTACVAGPSKSGKTQWILKFLQHLDVLLDKSPSTIVWCYGELGGVPKEVQNNPSIQKHCGVPTEDSGLLTENSLIILDDLMQEAYNQNISDLYTRGSRHRKISIILLTQNLFHQSKNSRDISLSTRYFVLLKNCRDKFQFNHLAKQIYPENSKSLCSALHDAWSKPFNYLLVDLDPCTPDALRFRTNIWPTDPFMIVYANDQSIDCLQTQTGGAYCKTTQRTLF